jgi:hypothetical protein
LQNQLLKKESRGVSYYNDAFVIAGGINQVKVIPVYMGQKHKNNRALKSNRKGFKPSIRRQRYSIQPYDLVAINNKKYSVKGCCNYGKWIACSDGRKTLNFNIKKVKKVFSVSSIYSSF